MVSFSNLAKNKNKGNGTFIPRSNILVRITSFELDNPSANNPEKDFAVGVLMADALGMKAGDTVKVKLEKREKTSSFAAFEIGDISRGVKKKISGANIEGGCFVEFQNCMPKNGIIEAKWLKSIRSGNVDKDNPEVFPVSGVFVHVSPEKKSDKKNSNGEDIYYQRVSTILTNKSQLVESKEQAINLAKTLLAKLDEKKIGDGGFVLRLINKSALTPEMYEASRAPEGNDEDSSWKTNRSVSIMGYRRSVKQADGSYAHETIDETIARFVENEDNQKVLDFIGPDVIAEIIPTINSTVGKGSLPSSARAEAIRNGRDPEKARDMSKMYKRSEKDPYGAYAASNISFMQRDDGSWFVAHANTIQSFDPLLVSSKDVITPHMPVEMKEALEKEWAAAVKAKKDANNGNNPADDAGVTPDPTGGLDNNNDDSGWGMTP